MVHRNRLLLAYPASDDGDEKEDQGVPLCPGIRAITSVSQETRETDPVKESTIDQPREVNAGAPVPGQPASSLFSGWSLGVYRRLPGMTVGSSQMDQEHDLQHIEDEALEAVSLLYEDLDDAVD